MAEMRQQFILLQAQLAETKKEMAELKKKDKDTSFACRQNANSSIGKTIMLEFKRHRN